MAEIDVDLNVDTKNASRSVQAFQKTATASFNKIALAAGAIATAFGVRKIIDAASQQQAAVQKLNTALALTGDLTAETSKEFQNFASELQANSTVGDELSLEMLALAKSMGATNEQAKAVVKSAADLSALTGTSLDSNVRNLTKTLGGVAGRLAEVEPAVRSLTQEQLKAGAAIDLVANKFAGGAQSLTKTFSGAATQASNSFGDLLEKLGDYIIQNPIVVNAISFASKQFDALGAVIEENRDSITRFIKNGLVSIFKFVPKVILAVKKLVIGFKSIPLVFDFILLSASNFILDLIKSVDSGFKQVLSVILRVLSPIEKAIDTTGGLLSGLGIISSETASKFKGAFAGLKESIQSNDGALDSTIRSFENFSSVVSDSLNESIKSVNESGKSFDDAAKSVDSMGNSLESLLNEADAASSSLFALNERNKNAQIQSELTASQLNEQAAAAKKLADENKKTLEGQIASPLFSVAEGEGKKTFTGFTAGFVKAAVEGAEGAKRILVDAGTALANVVVPGLGAAVGPILSVLSQGKEKTREFVRDFAKSFPILVEAIIDSLPVLIVELIKAMPKLALALQKALFTLPITFLESAAREIFSESIRDGFVQFREFIKDFFKSFGTALSTLFKDLFSKVSSGLRSLVSGIGSFVDKVIFEPFRKLGSGISDGFKSLTDFEIPVPDLPKIEFDLQPVKDVFNKILEGLLFIPNKLIDLFNGLKFDKVEVDFTVLGERIKFTVLPAVDLIPGEIPNIPIPKLAKGGEIPQGFPNDTFPSLLSSGENVVDRSTNEDLKAFLRDNQQSRNLNIKLVVGEKELADVMLNLNRQGFRTS